MDKELGTIDADMDEELGTVEPVHGEEVHGVVAASGVRNVLRVGQH